MLSCRTGLYLLFTDRSQEHRHITLTGGCIGLADTSLGKLAATETFNFHLITSDLKQTKLKVCGDIQQPIRFLNKLRGDQVCIFAKTAAYIAVVTNENQLHVIQEVKGASRCGIVALNTFS
jgi:hypothetical protein